MKVFKAYNSLSLILILLLLLITELSPAQPGNYYPPPSSISYQTDTLTINPPDSLPGDPVILLGYNIYVDDDFYDNVMVTNPLDPIHFYLDDKNLLPGERIFCVDAVYNEWISESACDTAVIIYGYELPFYENWSSGSFETLQWTTDSDHWVINSDDGNPTPSVSFLGEPGLTDYEAVLESYPINAVGMTIGKIWLDFNITFMSSNPTGDEILLVQVWKHSSQAWTTVAEYSNGTGGIGWVLEHWNIRTHSINKVFKIRFVAKGVNSQDIAAWSIDNIHIYRKCNQPLELELEEGLEGNVLNWIPPDGPSCDEWIHWDDGMNSGTSIGPNEPVEFDVAARWIPEMLYNYNGLVIDKVSFFPAENAATYWVRVWTGSGPDSLVTNQLVNSPVMNQWNTVTLDIPAIMDVTKELWVGYHISTPYGWPAGVDDGPAIDEFGNMIFWENEWQTLLDISNELDYNWNIACHLSHNTWGAHFNIYRNTNQQGFELYDVAFEPEYLDNSIVLSDYYCYKVTLVNIDETDTCESDPTNSACEVLMLGTGTEETESHILVFPNPAKDLLNIESPEKIKDVRIYNVLGECVLKMEIGNLEGKVDVSGLENGIYFVEVVTEKMNFKDKILVFR